mgnify:FL=1
MGKYSEKSKKYTTEYVKEHYERVLLRLKTDEISRDDIRSAADQAGESVNTYIVEAVRRRMKDERLTN